MLTIEVDGNDVALYGTEKGNEAQRTAVRRPWVWSRRVNAWVLPRSLRPETREYNVQATRRALEAAGFSVEVNDTGARLSVAEEREARTERLEHRADRHEYRAARKGAEAEAQREYSDRLVEHIPFGQPILVGHHSERGHRRTLERSQNAMFRYVEASAASREAERKAGSLRRALERGTPLVTLRNRIDRLEADIRRYARNGQVDLLARSEEELELDRAELAARQENGAKIWGPSDFKPGDHVTYWGGKSAKVVRVNAKTLSVESGYSWTDKLKYQDVRGMVKAEEWGE